MVAVHHVDVDVAGTNPSTPTKLHQSGPPLSPDQSAEKRLPGEVAVRLVWYGGGGQKKEQEQLLSKSRSSYQNRRIPVTRYWPLTANEKKQTLPLPFFSFCISLTQLTHIWSRLREDRDGRSLARLSAKVWRVTAGVGCCVWAGVEANVKKMGYLYRKTAEPHWAHIKTRSTIQLERIELLQPFLLWKLADYFRRYPRKDLKTDRRAFSKLINSEESKHRGPIRRGDRLGRERRKNAGEVADKKKEKYLSRAEKRSSSKSL